jgi:YggT family protein
MEYLIRLINLTAELVSLLVVVWVILTWVMSPYHPVRRNLDRLVEPLLAPIRRVIPPLGMFDVSPIVFIIVVQLLASLLTNLLATLRLR